MPPGFERDVMAACLDHQATAAHRTAARLVGSLRAVDGERAVVSSPTAETDERAAAAGLRSRRDLFQLRRPLPVEDAVREGMPALELRAFVVGQDEDAWLEVNNRSFADHPDQSGQTRADIEAAEREPWFDPEGFLLLDGPAGRLDGFCWTKVHQATADDPAMGEIYVIGVDPSAGGRGLGGALTVAGLDHLARRGLEVGMLYVDESNAPARKMYARLGFAEHHRDRVYTP